ncbi:hypothetical protein PspCFBP13508_08710 [Pseudomonas sp. CFBP13508]|nr:hypothetical protein PspCFBP13508_08710 [Pseudomonas sp. CFBP13508]
MVWWYGRLIKNFADKTGPLVMVTLRRVHGDLLTEELQACQIAISRLRFYSQGLILEDRLPVAKIALADAPVQGAFSRLLRLATGKKRPEAVILGRFSISTMAAFV